MNININQTNYFDNQDINLYKISMRYLRHNLNHLNQLDQLDQLNINMTNSYSYNNSDNESDISIDSSESIESFDSDDSSSSINLKLKKPRYPNWSYYIKNKNKKNKVQNPNNEQSPIYTGGFTSKFTKESPFINYLIQKRTTSCNLGPSTHIAAFISDLGKKNHMLYFPPGKFAIGENSERNRFGNDNMTTHAEMDALRRLDLIIPNKRCKKKSRMDLIVLRINKSGNLCESAPCFHCTKELSETNIININKLYFSRADGTITCVKFSEWVKNGTAHISKGWRWIRSKQMCMQTHSQSHLHSCK